MLSGWSLIGELLQTTDLLFLVSFHQGYKRAVGQMSQGLIRRLTVLSQYEEALVRINATAAERLSALKAKPQAAIQRDLLSICNDPFTVAQQLTHIELVREITFSTPEDFLFQLASKITPALDRRLIVYLLRYTLCFFSHSC